MTNKKHILAHLSTAEQILAHYEGLEPFPVFIKAFFRDNKKFGSRDRREISSFCYSFFRLGKALTELPIRERILIGHFLCNSDDLDFLQELLPGFVPEQDLTTGQKMDYISQRYPVFSPESLFPFHTSLSAGLDQQAFIQSHFVQPDLFIRLRPGRGAAVKKKLESAGISFTHLGESSLVLFNTTSLDLLGEADRDFIIQDLSSQKTADYFPAATELPASATVWDACAGSGGKSILARDLYPNASLYVSDVRDSILHNLRKRFSSAGIREYKIFLADLTETDNRNNASDRFFPKNGFDFVIADVPCSGSGTWGRNPWEMLYFPEEEMGHYQQLQQQILKQLTGRVKPGGYFLYITCSVYKQENEMAVDFILSNTKLRLKKSGLIEGYRQKADTMFAALFTL